MIMTLRILLHSLHSTSTSNTVSNAWNKLAGQAQQLLFERSRIFARIDSTVEDPKLICCILSSLGQNSLCMYMIAVLCGGSNGAGLFIRWM